MGWLFASVFVRPVRPGSVLLDPVGRSSWPWKSFSASSWSGTGAVGFGLGAALAAVAPATSVAVRVIAPRPAASTLRVGRRVMKEGLLVGWIRCALDPISAALPDHDRCLN